jgi:hypothetical protein
MTKARRKFMESKWREKKPLKVKARNKKYWNKNKDSINKKRRENYDDLERLKSRCKEAVRKALRNGYLIKPTKCEVCNQENKRIEGHHPDYYRPLDVNWVCPRCHRRIHRLID